MTLPNFLIVGAAKAGTTTLYEHLGAHPEVFMPRLKEPKFFAYEGKGDPYKYPVRSLEDYAALFKDVRNEKAIGEASPQYLYMPSAAGRIRQAIPEVRICIALRDPVSRSFSIYQMNLRNNGTNSGLSYLEALPNDRALLQGYHEDVKRYTDLFAPSRVKIMLFDDLVRDTPAVIRDLLGFLDVSADHVPEVPRVANPGGIPRRKLLHSVLNDHRLRAFGRRYVPKGLVDRARQLRTMNLKKQKLSPEERAEALAFFREDILRTQDLIGRDLSAWLRV